MLHALLPAYIHRQSDEHLLELIQACELALLDGTSTHGDMFTLVECEKEMLQREHRRVRRTLAGLRPQDYIDPKVSLSSLAAQHPVDLPAEAFDTESDTRNIFSSKAQRGAASTGTTGRLQSRASQARAAKASPERFNLRKALVGAKQAVTEKAGVNQPGVDQPVEHKALSQANPVQIGARPARVKRAPTSQPSHKRKHPTKTKPVQTSRLSSRAQAATRQQISTGQTARRPASKPIPTRERQD